MSGRKQKVEPEYELCPFTVLVDTREQMAFRFLSLNADGKQGGDGKALPLVVQTRRETLATGDYSIDGFDGKVAIERKEFGDFVNCCGNDRERFEGGQLERLSKFDFAAVVVEAGWAAVLQGHPHSNMSPKSIYRSVIAWQQRMPRIHWWFCDTRSFAEVTTFRILERFWRDNTGNTGKNKQGT